MALLATIWLVAIACGDDPTPAPTATTGPSATPSASPTSAPVPPTPTPTRVPPTPTPTTVPPTPSPVPSPTPTATATPAGPTLEQRLDRLVERLEEQRQTLHIPGMAIAVVQNDKVVLARGFGMADLEHGTPVTPETIFGIGSSTKAFTSTLVGMLVDEGKMSWDDPVTDYLPYYTMAIDTDDPDAHVTMRDMMSHRTGFPRMGLLASNNDLLREEVLHAAAGAEPWAPFREA